MWEIALVIAVVVFSITCFFIIRTLVRIDRMLDPLHIKVENLCDQFSKILKQTETRLDSLGSIFRTISNLGDISESKTRDFKNYILENPPEREETPLGEDLAKWALSTVSIYKKVLKKRSRHEK